MRKRITMVGGGIAAAAAAISLADSAYQVSVVAPPQTGGDRIGETLSASAEPVLIELGLWQRFCAMDFPRAQSSFSNWGRSELLEQHTFLQGRSPGWYLDRQCFTDMLWQEVPGIQRIEGQVERITRDQQWQLLLRDGSKHASDFLIDCSGRSGIVGHNQRRYGYWAG